MSQAISLKISDQDELVEILINSITLVFQTTFGIGIKLENCKSENSPAITGDVSGVLGLVQNFQEGNLIISFPTKTLSIALEKIYGKKFSEVDSTMVEATGEIANMIYGQFKKEMNGRGHNLQMALPTIVTSDKHKILQAQYCSGHSLSFSLPEGELFFVGIALLEK